MIVIFASCCEAGRLGGTEEGGREDLSFLATEEKKFMMIIRTHSPEVALALSLSPFLLSPEITSLFDL